MPNQAISIEIKGGQEFLRKLLSWPAETLQALEGAAFEYGERTLAVSKDGGEGYGGNVVPVDAGALMSSGHVQGPERSGSAVEVLIGYGGPSASYAAYVHEASERVNFQRPNSGPDYLRGPAEHMGTKVADIVQKRLEGVLK